MKQKKTLLLILFFVLIGLFKFANYAKGYYCNFGSLETDKETYFNDESIRIKASWELSYNETREISCVQIQIYNVSNNIIWESSRYTDIGYKEENWIVDIQSLNLQFGNYSNTLYIKFFYSYLEILSGASMSIFLKTIEIETIKRNTSTELIEFKRHINYGEDVSFKVRFHNGSITEDSYLVNHSVSFKIISNQIILFKKDYITDSSGIIEIFIPSITNLSIGANSLIFTISETKLYNSTRFECELYVDFFSNHESNHENSNKNQSDYSEIIVVASISSLMAIIFLLYFNYAKRIKIKF